MLTQITVEDLTQYGVAGLIAQLAVNALNKGNAPLTDAERSALLQVQPAINMMRRQLTQ